MFDNQSSQPNIYDEFHAEAIQLWERVQQNLAYGMMLSRGQARSLMDDLGRIRELAEPLNDPIQRGRATTYLAYIIHRRDAGDPAKNTELAISLAKEALEFFTKDINEPLELAWTYTTLGMLYNERRRSSAGVSNEVTAEGYLRKALDIRQEHGSNIDWAYTATNLADTLAIENSQLSDDEIDARLAEASSLSESATQILLSASDEVRPAGAQAAINYGTRLLRRAQRQIRRRGVEYIRNLVSNYRPEDAGSSIPEGSIDDVARQLFERASLARLNPEIFGDVATPEWAVHLGQVEDPTQAEFELINRAAIIAEQVNLAFRDTEVGPRALCLWGDALSWRPENLTQATALYQDALNRIGQIFDPDFVANVGGKAGDGWSKLQLWSNASDAFVATFAAIDEIYKSQVDTRDQDETLARNPKLIESAAFSLVRCGKLNEAIRLLEGGRARRLTRAVLSEFPSVATVRKQSVELAEQLNDAIGGDSKVPVELERKIRRLPGLSGFPVVVDDDEIQGCSTALNPLLYVVSTPSGTVTLGVDPSSGPLNTFLVGDTDVTSSHLAKFLWNVDVERQEERGLFSRDSNSLDRTLAEQADALGKAFGSAIAEFLESKSLHSVTLVATGLLGSSPIAAATIDRGADGTASRRLIDVASVRIVPTAAFLQGLMRRDERRPKELRSYFGAGDASGPSPRLPNSEPEVRSAAEKFEEATVVLREEATLSNVWRNVGSVDVLHFACHGYSEYSDASKSYLELSDGNLTVADLIDTRIGVRVALLSACESAQYASLNSDANQVVGLATAFLTAGASTVVASLAQIDDLAAFALTQRYIEELLLEPHRADASAAALRSAQRWLINADRLAVANSAVAAVERLPDATRGITQWVKKLDDRKKEYNSLRSFQLRDWAQFVNIGI